MSPLCFIKYFLTCKGWGGRIIVGARCGKISIEVDPVLFFIVLYMILSGRLMDFLFVFMSILLHEIVHIAATLALGGKIYTIRIMPVGLNAVVQDFTCSRFERIIICLSGPFINMVLAITCVMTGKFVEDAYGILAYLAGINAGLFIFNLIPVLPLDGGRILKELLSAGVGIFLASRYIRRFSYCLSAFLICAGMFQIYKWKGNPSLILLGVYIFFALKSEGRENAMMNVKNIIFRRSRLLNKGIYPARDLVVLDSIHMGEVIKHMDHDRFHIIHVLDEELMLVKTLTEQEVIDAMIKYNAEITFKEFLNYNKVI